MSILLYEDGAGRAPQGARGLKFGLAADSVLGKRSRPARGAWVEISIERYGLCSTIVAPRKGRVG